MANLNRLAVLSLVEKLTNTFLFDRSGREISVKETLKSLFVWPDEALSDLCFVFLCLLSTALDVLVLLLALVLAPFGILPRQYSLYHEERQIGYLFDDEDMDEAQKAILQKIKELEDEE